LCFDFRAQVHIKVSGSLRADEKWRRQQPFFAPLAFGVIYFCGRKNLFTGLIFAAALRSRSRARSDDAARRPNYGAIER
jgi:hypothetical protein